MATDLHRAVDAPAAVAVKGLDKSFGTQHVLKGVDLDIAPGEFTALLGRSGSGKSTLLRVLAGLDTDYDGEVAVPGRRAVAFQDSRLLPWKRVLDNVLLGQKGKAAKAKGLATLDEVGLADKAKAWPHTLSGGEGQRAALARALVREPELLLLDEPFGALDALTRLKMHALLRKLWAAHQPSVLLVTHDVEEAIALADRVLVLTEGRISLDVRVELPQTAPRRSREFADLRDRLLAELGVAESER
ncbi:ABC transporter ATP-binding protein [Glycomyces dulcitolivorans]|uniref:ABC transporter ATP-binding protein n=1 Tax=Glycomyces dulcitolivorans TaxID=2200759 RepID=UPI000DD3BE8B|nr:ABC transporter ATP-binding protein [Glycomyces dulcitolivorans]